MGGTDFKWGDWAPLPPPLATDLVRSHWGKELFSAETDKVTQPCFKADWCSLPKKTKKASFKVYVGFFVYMNVATGVIYVNNNFMNLVSTSTRY